jgi:hypothetical protein
MPLQMGRHEERLKKKQLCYQTEQLAQKFLVISVCHLQETPKRKRTLIYQFI